MEKFKNTFQAFYQIIIIQKNLFIAGILFGIVCYLYHSKQQCMIELNDSKRRLEISYKDLRNHRADLKKEREKIIKELDQLK